MLVRREKSVFENSAAQVHYSLQFDFQTVKVWRRRKAEIKLSILLQHSRQLLLSKNGSTGSGIDLFSVASGGIDITNISLRCE